MPSNDDLRDLRRRLVSAAEQRAYAAAFVWITSMLLAVRLYEPKMPIMPLRFGAVGWVVVVVIWILALRRQWQLAIRVAVVESEQEIEQIAERERNKRNMGAHLIDGQFQSDKYPTTPRGKVPLSVKDVTAQDLLWEYAQRRRHVDPEFASDLETALRAAGFEPWTGGLPSVIHHDGRIESGAERDAAAEKSRRG